MKTYFCLFFLFISPVLFNQVRKPKSGAKDTMSAQAFIQMVEKSIEDFYAEFSEKTEQQKILDELEKDPIIPELSDEEICKQIHQLNLLSSYKLDCNPINLTTIRFFQKNRRSFIRICLSRSKLYFDLYEEYLNKYDLPKELRFLSVIESGLRPQVKSPAGALGLWQFMYGTGKMYGLAENSYIDERMDPIKSTEAACKYLKKLFDIYGDWNLALAAYNAGPGNVNKAIRRSGGKKTYWEVRPFLPRETQGYVPNFVAATYLMTYYKENKLFPVEIPYYQNQLDSVCINNTLHMESISSVLQIELEEIKKLNPIFKKTIIPESNPKQCILLPRNKISKFIDLEDSIYAIENRMYNTPSLPLIVLPQLNDSTKILEEDNLIDQSVIYHKVKKGETISKIAYKYKVSTNDIKKWNRLRSNKLSYGKNLKIILNEKELNKNSSVPKNMSKSDSVIQIITYDTLVIIYHVVQRNETIENIANLYKVKTADLLLWNNLNSSVINVDQKLQIYTKIQLSKEILVSKNSKKELPKKENETKVNTNKPKYYSVRSGDLFNRVAQKHQMSQAELQKLNPGVNPDKIRVGQKLRVK
ncbi:MAG: LysM peptidoglycan-binding domain-containing protein [Flavobacteriia bacterium]|nr:LysM peptidoglycan-binding domain-containing protein [Flavobacteriia bacterium]